MIRLNLRQFSGIKFRTRKIPDKICVPIPDIPEKKNKRIAKVNNYKSFIKQRGKGENKRTNKVISSKRWVVEACHSWFNRFRKVLVRYEKKSSNYLALCMLAAAIITLN